MIIRIAAFTEQGKKTAYRTGEIFSDEQVSYFDKESDNLSEWTRQGFLEKEVIIFVGAMGIAVRKIAPFIESKLTDSPVIVVDELGKFVIPVLSGHVGGANEIAERIAVQIGATPVITTATDINDKFAVDVFAVKHRLKIVNKGGIKLISAKILSDEKITVCLESGYESWLGELSDIRSKFPEGTEFVQYPPENQIDVLITTDENSKYEAKLMLAPKMLVLGMGCKKDKEVEAIEELVTECQIDLENVYALASIDIKKNEVGLRQFASRHKLDFITFSRDELLAVPGDFSGSEFVMQTVGVDNVCERAALAGAGPNSVLIMNKTSKNGVTAAVAHRYGGKNE